jgi:inactivated superfamily I helicase
MSYIKSPQTGKPIKKGGFAHKKLIKEGYFQDEAVKKDITKKEIIQTPDDTHELVKQTSRNAMNVMRKIKAGQIELPADMDNDEQISNYIQQCLLLEMIQKPAKPAKKKRMVKPPVSSSESESETE